MTIGDKIILDRVAVSNKVGLSLPTIWREQTAGRFPPYFKLSARRVGIRASDLEQWLEGRRNWAERA